MRPMWSGSIAFGLVNIPVRAYGLTDDAPIDLDMLHQTDHGKIRYAYVCEKEGREVPYKEIVKGYKTKSDEYVILTKDELAAVKAKRTDTLSLEAFVKTDGVDPIYFEKPYYLEPGKGAEHTYALLRDALMRTERIGIASFVFRNKERIGAIIPYGGALILNQMRFESQIRHKLLPKKQASRIKEPEMKMAVSLIDALAGDFDAAAFKDTTRADMARLIARKEKGETIKATKHAPLPATRIDDLVATLKESLNTRTGARRASPLRAASKRTPKPVRKAVKRKTKSA